MNDCYIVAVSGGSDSMALLDIVRKQEKNIVVCHVNYGVRDSATRDENIVRSYCKKYGIKLELLKCPKYDKKEGNFENWARVIRYNFFRQVYKKYNCKGLLVGHNLDDFLETYFIQKDRKARCDYLGIKEETFIYNMNVNRPVLSYTKEDLKEYCKSNNIEYGVDETNFDNKYLRNNFRHTVIAKMSLDEKKELKKEIDKENEKKDDEYQRIHKLLNNVKKGNNIIDLGEFNKLDEQDKITSLYYFVIENVKVKISISNNRLLDIIKKISSTKPNIVLGKFENYFLFKEYKSLVIKKEENEFSYTIDDLNSDLNEFTIRNKGKKLERIIASKDLFPLVIENYKGDNKDINRLMIDKKIPVSERKKWPVVKDKLGRVLLVINLKKFYNIKDLDNENLIDFYICKKEKENFNE